MKRKKSVATGGFLLWLFSAFWFFTCQPGESWKFERRISFEDIQPLGIAFENKKLWVSDAAGNRVVKIDLTGRILQQYGGFQRPMHIAITGETVYVPEYLTDSVKTISQNKIGNLRLGEKPDAPAGIAVDGDRVAIADFYNHRIILQTVDSVLVICREGHAPGELYYPTDVAFVGGLLYVADAFNNRVQVFDLAGKLQRIIGAGDSIRTATGLTVSGGRLFVADFENSRLLVYDLEGNLLQQITGNLSQPTDIAAAEDKIFVTNYGSNSVAVFRKE